MLVDEGVVHDLVVRGHGADDEAVALLADAAQGVDPPEVDDDRRRVEPHPQDGEQALPAGQDLGVVAGFGEGGESLLDRGRSGVVECCGDHDLAPFASWMADQTRCGVHGIVMSVTPIGRSASTIALTTAGVDAIVPASPTPLVPKVLVVHGDVVWSMSKLIVSAADGQRVVDERRRDQGAGLVVHRLLPERLGDALHEAAVHLAGDDQRVDDRADVVDGGVLAHRDLHRSRCRPPSRRGGCRAGRRSCPGRSVADASRLGSAPSGRSCAVEGGHRDRPGCRRPCRCRGRRTSPPRTPGRPRTPRAGARRSAWPSRCTLSAALTTASAPTTSEREP